MTLADIWVQFACAALTGESAKEGSSFTDSITDACNTADGMMLEYDKRYGDRQILLDGIRHCNACHKENVIKPNSFLVTISPDGELKKVCNECVEKHKHGEEIGTEDAVCLLCGQAQATIFKCPGEPAPCIDDGTLSEDELNSLAKWREKLNTGGAHEFT